MTSAEKISQLQKELVETLTPLINKDYYLLEVPYYTNIGDTLIWQGELDFLAGLPYKCKGMYSLETFRNANRSIEPGSLVLFQGGGNFGDLWPIHHDFKMDIMRKNPTCSFLFFPQTVWFEDRENLRKCASFMSQFKHVAICARDSVSYKTLKENFRNTVLLLPDMAFCIDMERWRKEYKTSGPLLLKRTDKELQEGKILSEIERIEGITVTDWQTMQNGLDLMTKLMLHLTAGRLKGLRLGDAFVRHFYRPYLVRLGVKLLNSHTHIYTTRLHAAILGVLLGKDITLLDNSYGKNRTFFESWLSDYDNIKLVQDD